MGPRQWLSTRCNFHSAVPQLDPVRTVEDLVTIMHGQSHFPHTLVFSGVREASKSLLQLHANLC